MRIVFACLLTVAIEGAFFYLAGFRTWFAGTVVVCTNVITNIILNLFLGVTGWYGVFSLLILETLVVLTEYGIYEKAFGRSKTLLLETIAANLLSFAVGLFVF